MYDETRGKVTITKLMLMDTGTYNPMYYRPYTVDVTGRMISNIAGRVAAAQTNNLTGAVFAGLGSSFLHPSSSVVGDVSIPNNWNERRIRFLMEVNVEHNFGAIEVYRMQGYTDYADVSYSGLLDENMLFIINSIIVLNRNMVNRNGQLVWMETLASDDQILSRPMGYSGTTMLPGQNTFAMLRPQDIFTGIQSEYVRSSIQGFDNTYIDNRIQMGNIPNFSFKGNNIATSYLAKLLTAHQTATQMQSWGKNEQDITTAAMQNVMEHAFTENIFIEMLNQHRGFVSTATFRYNELQKIFPDVSKVMQYVSVGQVQRMSQLPQAGQSAYWNSSDNITLAATILGNAIPALMIETMLGTVNLMSTNHDNLGAMNTVIIDGQNYTNTPMANNYELFKYRLEKEVLYDVTHGNNEKYTLKLYANINADTIIDLSLGTEPETRFVLPTFCDSLFSPILSPQINNYEQLTHDLQTLIKHVDDETGFSSVSNNGLTINRSV